MTFKLSTSSLHSALYSCELLSNPDNNYNTGYAQQTFYISNQMAAARNMASAVRSFSC